MWWRGSDKWWSGWSKSDQRPRPAVSIDVGGEGSDLLARIGARLVGSYPPPQPQPLLQLGRQKEVTNANRGSFHGGVKRLGVREGRDQAAGWERGVRVRQ